MTDKKTPYPYLPANYDIADIAAIQALVRGEATPDQQLRALTWIIEGVCKTYDETYFSGYTDAERDTSYALGKRYVGNTIVKATKLSINALKAKSKSDGE